MQLIGQTVQHQVFGRGVVTGKGDGTLTVSFSLGEKRFLYPDAFQKFLVLQDAEMQNCILKILQQKEEEQHRREKTAEEKWEQEAKLRNMKISARAQGAFDIRPDEAEETFLNWRVSTGVYLSGYSKGEPRLPERMKANSMCLLTTREDGTPESDRRITGMFMAKDTFDGSQCTEGIITAHSEYRLRLEPKVQPLFWPYIAESKNKQKWGNTAFKYVSNTVAEKILDDIRNEIVRNGTPEQTAEIELFYQYYCRLNHLQPSHS